MSATMTLPLPTPYCTPDPPAPTGHRLVRGLTQLTRGELPTPLQGPFDHWCNRVGWRFKTVRTHGLTIRLRRQTADEAFIYKILTDQEYTPAPDYTIRPTDTVIDIGGNIGVFALHAAQTAARVLTYEPVLENYELLQRNLYRNGTAHVIAHRVAVAGAIGTLRIFTTPSGHEATGSHSIHAAFAGSSERFEDVAATTLPAIFAQHRIERCHFLKVDCEGAEYAIFDATPSAVLQRIDRIAMEYHTPAIDPREKHAHVSPLLRRLLEEGFHIDTYLDSTGFRSGFLRARRLMAP